MFHGRAIFLVDVLVNAIAAVLLLLFTLSPRLQAVAPPPPRKDQIEAHVLLVEIALDQDTSAENATSVARENSFRRTSISLIPPGSKSPLLLAVPDGRLPWHLSATPKQYEGYSGTCDGLQGVVLDDDQLASILSARAWGLPGVICSPDQRTLQIVLPCLKNEAPGDATWRLTLTYATSDLAVAPPLVILKPRITLDDVPMNDNDVTMDNSPSAQTPKSCNNSAQRPLASAGDKSTCELRASADVHVSWRQPAKASCNRR